ncbi:MAG: efflux RND transporter periplasmic adaptor subunit [Saprospiraceae bacterium]|nr:efflux RND transporter periplasmic adaptor subunit [Saprospiraceae bacterium]
MRYITNVILFTTVSFFACKESDTPKIAPERELKNSSIVKMAPVQMYTESPVLSCLGIVMSESEAKPSFKTGGVIAKTYVREGDNVKNGQLLATLLMDEINAQVRQAEEGGIKAERDMNRVKKLYSDSVATLEQMQNTTTAYEVARRNIEIAKFNRQYSEVRAPIAGKIIRQIMKSGEVTGPGTPVFVIMGIGRQDWVIKAGLIDRDWARTTINNQVTIMMDAYPGKTFEGYVSDKTSVGGNASGTFDVEIKFKNMPSDLAAGLTCNVDIRTDTKENYSVIPIEALVKTNGNKAYAFTVVDGKAKKIVLTIARLLGDKVAISQGLEGVKEVVTIGAMYLEEGDDVMLK